ncbi:MAG TPA: cytochrome c [Burkholderiales bacterium]|nr:cytochrome c [Burkholderiales bacterium]
MKLLFLLLLLPLSAVGQPLLVQGCAGCHGAQGEGNASEGAPRIAGQPQAYLERQLAAFADGRRENGVMTPIARQLTPEQRTALSTYYSDLRARAGKSSPPAAANARGRALATRGDRALNVQACQSCHGPGGTGFGNVNPYLAGLDRRYLEMALGEWKSGSRKTDPSQQMNQIASNLGDADIKALAAYFASQPLPQPATTATQKPPRIGAPDERTRPGTATTPRAGTGVTGGEPSGSQGPGGSGTK